MNEREIYEKALKKWGAGTQMGMAMSEAGELIAALGRLVIQRRDVEDEVIDGLADMEIMLGQMRVVFDADKIDARKSYKLELLSERVR